MADESTIFGEALACESPAARLVYLERVCAGDPQLKTRVLELLAAHDRVGSILDAPAASTGSSLLDPLPEPTGTMIGPYKLLELIGEGGMGLVYRAEQQQPVRRQVALKIIKPGMDTRQVIARFEVERQALAMLDHPHIAKVFDAGMTQSGRSYFVMELVRGIGIVEYCDQAQLGLRQRLELFVRVCQGVQHAHGAGIIHRDLKPANILVTMHDDQPVPKIIDFGIAKATTQRLTDQTLFTNFLQMLGTPVYMSPEQAQLSALDVDARSDIYSLGVILYELLTGSTPFESNRLRSAGYAEIQRILRDEEPPPPSAQVATLGNAVSTIAARRSIDPRRYRHSLRGDLDWIAMRCLEKDRSRRYQSAEELTADLRRHLNNEPVHARRPTVLYRLQKFAKRRRTALMVTAALLLASGLLLEAIALRRAVVAPERPHVEVPSHLEAALTVDPSLRHLAYAADLQEAWQAYKVGRLDQVRPILERQTPTNDDSDLRSFEWWFLSTASEPPPSRVLKDHLGDVFDAVWSPSGKYLVTVGLDRRAIIRDGASGEPLTAISGFTRDLNSATFHVDEAVLALAEEAHAASFWDWRTGELIRRINDFQFPVAQVFLTSDPEMVVITDVHWGSKEANTTVWKWRTGEQLASIERLRSLAINPERTLLAASRSNGDLVYLSIPDLEPVQIIPGTEGPLAAADFSPNGETLVTSTYNGFVRCWQAGTRAEVGWRPHGMIPSRAAAFAPDGRMIASGCDHGDVRLLDCYAGRLTGSFRTDNEIVWSARFAPDGKTLAVSHARCCQLYDLTRIPSVSRLIYESTEDLRSRVLVVGQSLAIMTDQRRSVEIHDLDGIAPVREVNDPCALGIDFFAFAPDLTRLWMLESSQRLHVRDMSTGDQRLLFTLKDQPNRTLLSPGFEALATSPHGECWALNPPQQLPGLPLGPDGERHIHAFLDDQHVLSTVRGTHALEIYNIVSGEKQPHVFDVSRNVDSVAVSPDRSLVAIGTGEPAIHLWDLTTGQDRHVLLGHSAAPQALAFSPDGRTLASTVGSEMRLWQAATGRPLADFSGELTNVGYLAFSGDGRQLIAVGSTREKHTGIIAWGGRIPLVPAE